MCYDYLTTLAACRILQTLRVRYTLDLIYTYSGNILIAVGARSGFHAAIFKRVYAEQEYDSACRLTLTSA